MVTRVLSLVRGADAGAARAIDPALDVNAYAVADEIELTLVLKDRGVELALDDAIFHADPIAGVEVPAAAPATDLRALLASGVRVLAVRDDLVARGLGLDDLVDGIEEVESGELSRLIIEHDVTLSTTS